MSMEKVLSHRSLFAKGNADLRAGRYVEAVRYYAQAIINSPYIGKHVAVNLAIARKKYRESRRDCQRPKVAVSCWELAHNPAGRAYTLALLYQSFADVEIIGSVFPSYGREIWEPIRDTSIPKHMFIAEEEGKFVEQAIELVAAHPYDVVHLSKPRAPNIFIGILYKHIWGAKVLMDIDDEELAFVGAEKPLSVEEYIELHGDLPKMYDLPGQKWTRIAVGFAKEFDGVTVSNIALQQRYGGTIIPHARDAKAYNLSREFKRQSREKYGIPHDKKVVLFFGTPRAHKGLVETAQAIAALRRSDIIFAIVGVFPDKSLKERLKEISGVDYRFIGNQPFTEIPSVNAIADLCLLLQDQNSLAAQFQIPAKLTDALAMGIPVLGTSTPALADVVASKAITVVEDDDVEASLMLLIDTPTVADELKVAGSRYFKSTLSLSVCVVNLEEVIAQLSQAAEGAAKNNFAILSEAVGLKGLVARQTNGT